MATQKQEQVEKKRFIVQEKRIDKHTILRERYPVTEATCLECGFDVCRANKMPDFDTLLKSEQKSVKEALDEHIEKMHRQTNAKILTEDELPGGWLGEKRGHIPKADVN